MGHHRHLVACGRGCCCAPGCSAEAWRARFVALPGLGSGALLWNTLPRRNVLASVPQYRNFPSPIESPATRLRGPPSFEPDRPVRARHSAAHRCQIPHAEMPVPYRARQISAILSQRIYRASTAANHVSRFFLSSGPLQDQGDVTDV